MNRSPAASLPLWIGISVLINCVLVIAASTALTARANTTSDSERIVLQATLHQPSSPDRNTPERTRHKETVTTVSQNTPDPADSRIQHQSTQNTSEAHTPSSRKPQTPPSHQERRDSARTGSSKPAESPTNESAAANEDNTPEKATEATEYDVPQSSGPVAVKADRYGQKLGAGLPGAGKSGSGDDSDTPAGGGAEVIAARGSGGSFSVGGIPGASGHGPGLGGSGSGIGVGGSCDGVAMPGSGRGPGTGGQGGDAPLPRKVAPDADAIPGVPQRSKKSALASTGGKTSQKPSEKATRKPEKSDTPKQSAKEKKDSDTAAPSKADLSRFQTMVQRKIQSAKSYPPAARRNGQSGRVRVSFSVNPSGQPTGISVTGSSGHSALDSAALRAVRNAGPFRPFPKGLNTSIRVNASVSFTLN